MEERASVIVVDGKQQPVVPVRGLSKIIGGGVVTGKVSESVLARRGSGKTGH